MYSLLDGLRVVEGASFIAAPSCALHLAQMGAEVIRFDQIGGGPDFGRWPKAAGGFSFYWEGLNKGKKSVALDLSRPEGRELAAALVTAPGPGAGLFVTNFPADGFLSHARLAGARPDLITVRVTGWATGDPAFDYTVNAAIGIPLITGPTELGDAPVNHVLPAWDIATGLYAAFALVAAERRRALDGDGGEIRVPLGNVAMATIGHLGQIAEVAASEHDRQRYGNDVFGTFGRDFPTRDGRRVIILAITRPQWRDLVAALGIGEAVAALEAELGIDLASDDGLRFTHRDRLNPLVAGRVEAHALGELERLFAGTRVCWAPYRRLSEAIGEPGLISDQNPLFATVAHPSGHSYLTPGAPAVAPHLERRPPARGPKLGEHTDEVLAKVLGLTQAGIGRLHDQGIVAGPAE